MKKPILCFPLLFSLLLALNAQDLSCLTEIQIPGGRHSLIPMPLKYLFQPMESVFMTE